VRVSEVREQQPPAGAQDPVGFAPEARGIGVAVRGLDAEHGVERAIGERELVGVTGDEAQAGASVASAAAVDRSVREVEAGHRAWPEALEHERGAAATTAAHLEHVLSS
jgi:hypothetical protein